MKYAQIDTTGKVKSIGEGEFLPDGYIEISQHGFDNIQNSFGIVWNYVNGEFQQKPYQDPLPTLDQAKAAKTAEMDAACATAIIAGQVSSALGAAHTYPTKDYDQANITANVLDSLLPLNVSNPSWVTYQLCEDTIGVWAYHAHTAAQIQQVGNDVKMAILTLLMKNNVKKAVVATCTTVVDVQAVAW